MMILMVIGSALFHAVIIIPIGLKTLGSAYAGISRLIILVLLVLWWLLVPAFYLLSRKLHRHKKLSRTLPKHKNIATMAWQAIKEDTLDKTPPKTWNFYAITILATLVIYPYLPYFWIGALIGQLMYEKHQKNNKP